VPATTSTNAPVAIVPVRDGVLAPGGDEVVAEAHGRTILIGSGLSAAAASLVGLTARAGLAETDVVAFGAWAAALAPLLVDAPFVLLPASPDGRDLAPRLAARLGWPIIANAIEVGPKAVVVVDHGGLVQKTLDPGGQFVATLQPGVRGVNPNPAADVVFTDPLALVWPESADVRVLEVLPPDPATMDLAEAPRIIGGGAGLMADDAVAHFAQLTAVGERIGASMGATRVVTDAGWVGHERQIGTTGVAVDPDLYLAFGISGAVQHTAGLGHPDHIVSVNVDPHCPMMAMADLAVVADAPAVLSALADRLAGVAFGESTPDV
jgi:electron transfer flavoprotein alpha subunit